MLTRQRAVIYFLTRTLVCTLMTSSKPINSYLPKDLPPITIPLEVRVSTYEFAGVGGGGSVTVQATTVLPLRNKDVTGVVTMKMCSVMSNSLKPYGL